VNVVIVDYGSGNLRSAAKAFERAAQDSGIAADVAVSAEAASLRQASHIVLPGVGAFADCKRGLEALPGMIDALNQAVLIDGRPFFGICVGMQLMAELGHEHGEHKGLGWIKGSVEPLEPSDSTLKVPHMGWNDLKFANGAHPLLTGVEPGRHAYFVHSYHMRCADVRNVLATVDYGGAVTAVTGRDNIVGTQFHPEKSQDTGLTLIANFLRWRP
jgi:imidazole glycerol-phosphate synthase subunit HisH